MKLVGLSKSIHRRIAAIGQASQTAFSGLQEAICTARASESPPDALASANAARIETFRQTLERYRDDPHETLRAVVRELARQESCADAVHLGVEKRIGRLNYLTLFHDLGRRRVLDGRER